MVVVKCKTISKFSQEEQKLQLIPLLLLIKTNILSFFYTFRYDTYYNIIKKTYSLFIILMQFVFIYNSIGAERFRSGNQCPIQLEQIVYKWCL
jgi:hypothetical protein